MVNLCIRIRPVGERLCGTGGGPNKNLYPKPEPQAILGLNSTVVYGSNVQIAFPINFQMALGSNLQVCISPTAWATLYGDNPEATLPASFNSFLGSGLGGNMQLTMGTNANFVMGQTFDINLGPRRITLDVHDSKIRPLIEELGSVMLAAAVAFLLAYGAGPDDDFRAITVIIFQLLMQVTILLLMDVKKIYHEMDQSYKETLDQVFGWDPKTKIGPTFEDTLGGESSLGEALISVALVTAMALPVLLEITGEGRLGQPDPPQVVVDSSGTEIGTVKDS